MMFVTLVAVLCHVSPGPSGACVEEIVTDSSKSDISFQSCPDITVRTSKPRRSDGDPAAERCLSASAAIRLASTAKAAPSTNPSAMQRWTMVSNSFRSRSQSRKRPCLFLEKVRVVGHLAVEAKPTEPAVSEVQVNLLAQQPFGTNAVAPYVA
jgi:hypothetical protein